MAMQAPDQRGQNKNGTPPSPRPRSLWPIWLILLIWNAAVLWPRNTSEAHIPYSAFVAQVQADNVTHVHLAGDAVTGDFTHPFTWPAGPAKKGEAKPKPYQQFATTFPEAVGDAALMPLLQSHHVEVAVAPPPSPWLSLLLVNGLPFLLLVLFFVWMSSRAVQSQSGILGFGRSRARSQQSDRPTVTFADVAGADEAKTDLLEVVDFLRNPKKYHAIGARIPRGVLLVGPPGTGKTLMARAVAGEAGVPFFSISASEFVEMFVGVGASRVRDLFEKAKVESPAIVFIDELDAVGRRRGAGMGSVNDEREQTLNQLLVEMDGFDPRQEVILLAATNRPDVLDPALLRPGRFDRQVEVPLPDKKGREGILKIHSRALPLASDVDLSELAAATTGFSGADLANLCNEAALVAARADRQQVTRADFFEAQDKVILGRARNLVLSDADRRLIAYHEGGHALVAWLTPNTDPVQKVTIIPRGRALGVTEQVPEEDRYNYSRDYLLARLSVMLGGRSAEELVFGDVTTGAENDLVEATRIARKMVTRWGMGSLSEVAFATDEEQPFLGYEIARGRDYSDRTAARIDQDVQNILAERHQTARRILSGAREKLDRLAEELLKQETVDHRELTRILGPRTVPEAHTPAAAVTQLAA